MRVHATHWVSFWACLKWHSDSQNTHNHSPSRISRQRDWVSFQTRTITLVRESVDYTRIREWERGRARGEGLKRDCACLKERDDNHIREWEWLFDSFDDENQNQNQNENENLNEYSTHSLMTFSHDTPSLSAGRNSAYRQTTLRLSLEHQSITEGLILEWPSVLQCVAVCCSVLQCVAVCCSVLQCVAVCCSVSL